MFYVSKWRGAVLVVVFCCVYLHLACHAPVVGIVCVFVLWVLCPRRTNLLSFLAQDTKARYVYCVVCAQIEISGVFVMLLVAMANKHVCLLSFPCPRQK